MRPPTPTPPKKKKRPCPYCNKLLVSTNKMKRRNNLARHLRNCAEFQKWWVSTCVKFVFDLLKDTLPECGTELGNLRSV